MLAAPKRAPQLPSDGQTGLDPSSPSDRRKLVESWVSEMQYLKEQVPVSNWSLRTCLYYPKSYGNAIGVVAGNNQAGDCGSGCGLLLDLRTRALAVFTLAWIWKTM
jgi:hypothetical protein